jgi:hypothetical protein
MERVPNLLQSIAESLATIAGKMADKKPQVKKVWVFTAEQACDGEVAETIVQTFATEQAARDYLHDFVYKDGDETIAEYVKKHDWEVEQDESWLYRAFSLGYYPTDHVECTITECEIKE